MFVVFSWEVVLELVKVVEKPRRQDAALHRKNGGPADWKNWPEPLLDEVCLSVAAVNQPQ